MSEITKESRAERAIACHNKAYNCAQSVAFAFLDKVDIDPETLFKVTEGLGLGMGGMEGTCGAISAAAVLAGLKISTADLEKPNSKGTSYKAAKACIAAFKEKNSTIVSVSYTHLAPLFPLIFLHAHQQFSHHRCPWLYFPIHN